MIIIAIIILIILIIGYYFYTRQFINSNTANNYPDPTNSAVINAQKELASAYQILINTTGVDELGNNVNILSFLQSLNTSIATLNNYDLDLFSAIYLYYPTAFSKTVPTITDICTVYTSMINIQSNLQKISNFNIDKYVTANFAAGCTGDIDVVASLTSHGIYLSAAFIAQLYATSVCQSATDAYAYLSYVATLIIYTLPPFIKTFNANLTAFTIAAQNLICNTKYSTNCVAGDIPALC